LRSSHDAFLSYPQPLSPLSHQPSLPHDKSVLYAPGYIFYHFHVMLALFYSFSQMRPDYLKKDVSSLAELRPSVVFSPSHSFSSFYQCGFVNFSSMGQGSSSVFFFSLSPATFSHRRAGPRPTLNVLPVYFFTC